MYTPHPDIRRHPDGPVDFDFYRRRAARLRARVLRRRVHHIMARLTLPGRFMDAQSKGADARSRTLAPVVPS
jgi:hypothetical protein